MKQLIYILLLKAVLLLGVIALGLIELGPDEAQYWTWSKFLDWGYYSKPPAIAWQIAFGTSLFGDTELGVRFGALLLGFLLPIAIYYLSLAAGTKSTTAFWAAFAFAVTPMGVLASLLAITDTGFVLFWTLALIPILTALRNETKPSYLIVGLLIAFGALFKWPIYYLWPLILFAWIWNPSLRSPQILLSMAISLLGLLPSLYWNANHDWVTFRHVLATFEGGSQKEARAPGNFWSFFGEQFLLFSPLLFALLIMTLRRKGPVPKPLRFCAYVSGLSLAVFLFLSLFQKMQGNWVDFAYPTAAVFLAWAIFEGEFYKKIWFYAGVSIAILTSLIAITLPLWAPYKIDPFKQNKGLAKLGQELDDLGYNPKEEFLVGDRYQTSSLLSFYTPAQKRAYFLNINGVRNNQFSFWPSLKQEQQGRSGYYIVIEKPEKLKDPQSYLDKIKPYFQRVSIKKIAPLVYSDNEPVKSALIIKADNYNGAEPPATQLY